MSATDVSVTDVSVIGVSTTDVSSIDEVPYSPLSFDDAAPYSPISFDEKTEPPSPGGSTKGLYVRSRPTSMDGAPIDFPGGPSDLGFSQFGMTAAAAPAVFPTPPVISLPPPGKKRRYAVSVKSLYTGPGTGTSLKTNCAPVVPVQLVRRKDLGLGEPEVDTQRRRWPLNALKKIVPGLFPRPAANTPRTPLGPSGNFELPALPKSSTTPPSARGRALSIRSFKSGKKKARAAVDAENRPPLPRARIQSFSGFLAEAAAEEDEEDAEMTAITREAIQTALRLNEEYEFAFVDPSQIGVAL
ncbi:hypothetical protein B0H17DRAFT_1135226 [Mycena rosella]|uniref:Uncharacterized protein n=1 Tax=Mycena rosella TaxID=1033263 RepID=A0AAD7DDR9_MYCRO|nr:hypothetical protein B0H17DRAFT_1135226 [Mycena rosella]